MGAKAVFFDMDGTLVYVPVTPVEFLSNVYSKLGLRFSLEQITIARRQAEEWWEKRYSDYTLRTRQAFIEYNHVLLEILGATGDLQSLAEEAQSYWENFPEEAGERLYREVRSVLTELREKRVILGVLSNRLLASSLKSLEKHAIGECFDHVIGPQTAGAPNGKKSPEMWRFAIDEVGANPSEVLHVDNDYEDGVVPARKAGIRPVLVDRKGVYTHITDCTVIRDLTEILELLEER